MQAKLLWALVACGVVNTSSDLARARGGPLRACKVAQARFIADHDGDGRRERVVRCHRVDRRGARCEELHIYYSRVGRRQVAGLCSAPDGADTSSGSIELRGDRVVQRRWGGTSWSWERRCDWDLTRRRVVSTREVGQWHAQKSNRYDQRVDPKSGRSEVRWWAPLCSAQRKDDPFGEPSRVVHQGRYVPIPLATSRDRACRRATVELPRQGYLRAKRGYSGPRDASLTISARDDGAGLHLDMHLRDDRLVAGDKLFVLIGEQPVGFEARCVPRRALPRRLTISAIERRLVEGRGSTSSLRATKAGRALRFDLRLEGTLRRGALELGVSVAYRDIDKPGERGAFFATSRLRDERDGRNLGRFAVQTTSHGQHGAARSCAEAIAQK